MFILVKLIRTNEKKTDPIKCYVYRLYVTLSVDFLFASAS